MAEGVYVFRNRQTQRDRLFLVVPVILGMVRSGFAHARLEVRGVELLRRRLFRITLTLATFAGLVAVVAADVKWA